MSPRTRKIRHDPPHLPEDLKGETPLVKFIWLWLLPQGVVSYSTRAMSKATGLSQPSVSVVLNRLRELRLLEDVREPRPRTRPVFRAVDLRPVESER